MGGILKYSAIIACNRKIYVTFKCTNNLRCAKNKLDSWKKLKQKTIQQSHFWIRILEEIMELPRENRKIAELERVGKNYYRDVSYQCGERKNSRKYTVFIYIVKTIYLLPAMNKWIHHFPTFLTESEQFFLSWSDKLFVVSVYQL